MGVTKIFLGIFGICLPLVVFLIFQIYCVYWELCVVCCVRAYRCIVTCCVVYVCVCVVYEEGRGRGGGEGGRKEGKKKKKNGGRK